MQNKLAQKERAIHPLRKRIAEQNAKLKEIKIAAEALIRGWEDSNVGVRILCGQVADLKKAVRQ